MVTIMHKFHGTRLLLAVLLAGTFALLIPSLAQPVTTFKVLVFSKTAAFRHGSIGAGIAAIQELGSANSFAVDTTEEAARFTDANLAQYDVVVFLSTTGDVLNATQQAAFERYIRAGGGYVGIHSASDTEYAWPWYGSLVGAYFKGHPSGTQRATINVENRAHPSTAHLGATWQRTDEWYSFQSNPRSRVQVLATLDESFYTPDQNEYRMGDHPIAWYHLYDGGRSWYTAGGHTTASFSEAAFRQHILGGIRWAAGVTEQPTPQPTTSPQPLANKQYLPLTRR